MYTRAFAVPQLGLLIFLLLTTGTSVFAQQSVASEADKPGVSILDSTRDEDGLFGPVRRVHSEMSRLSVNAGKLVEEPRMLLEVTTYDPQGKRIWNVYYPVNTGSFKGNQEFAYDEQGHVKEMTLRDDAGRVLSREAYTYEFDKFGNWTKMTSSLVIFESGKLIYEPFESTYRTISYYFDDSVAQIVKSSTPTAAQTTSVTVKDNPASIANKTKSGETAVPANQKPSDSSGAGASPVTNPAPINPSRTEEAKIEPPRDNETPPNKDVNVKASTEQAYQIPAAPIPKTPSEKPTISGGVVNGKILSLPKPTYPKDALVRGVFGKVVVEVIVDEKGQVIDARAISGNPLLRVSAVYAARLARFEPTLLSGQPVKATRLIDYDFNRR